MDHAASEPMSSAPGSSLTLHEAKNLDIDGSGRCWLAQNTGTCTTSRPRSILCR
jgi:hypothetical protein